MNNSNHITLLCACAWIADETRCESVNVFAKVTLHDHTKSTNCFKFRKTNESQIPKENFSGKKSYISATSISNPKFAKMHLDTFFSGRLFFPFCKGSFRGFLICQRQSFFFVWNNEMLQKKKKMSFFNEIFLSCVPLVCHSYS